MIDELTKSELKICKLLNATGSFDYSYNQLSNMLDMSIPTVWSSLKNLINKGYIKKIRFFEGHLPRNKYIALEKLNRQTVATTDNTQNLNRQTVATNTETKTDETVDNRGTDIKKESCRTTDHFLNPIKNTISSDDMINDIYINNISKSNQSDYTVFLKGCQEEISKKSKKNSKVDKFMAELDATFSPALSNYRVTTLLKSLFKKMWQEKNDNAKKVIQFFSNEGVEEKKDLINKTLNSFSRRMCNKALDSIRNMGAYLRKILVDEVTKYYNNRAMVNECKDVIPITNKLSNDTVVGKSHKLSCHNFEQRQYDDAYFEQFYCTC